MADAAVDVRKEDQKLINEFGRLNARAKEIRADRAVLQKQLEELDDATTELAMGEGDDVQLMLGGESFVDVSEDFATEHCEAEQVGVACFVPGLAQRLSALVGLLERRLGCLWACVTVVHGSSPRLEQVA